MVFATSSLVKANTASEGHQGDCATDAWNFGSLFIGYEYEATDLYFKAFC